MKRFHRPPARRLVLNASVALLAALAAAAQWVGPELPPRRVGGAGAIEEHVPVPGDVAATLRRACYDCHSNDTRWPAYSRVAPVSWLLAEHVRSGRGSLDFSDWSTSETTEPTPAQRLRGICHDLREGIMPPRAYRLVHPSSAVSEEETRRICGWVEEVLRTPSQHGHDADTPHPPEAG